MTGGMAGGPATLATVLLCGAVLAALWWAARRRRGRRISGAMTGPFEEIWHPAAHRARIEIRVQDERVDPPR